jgi:glycosyltransferase involved in cell wall biosynthesis
LTTINQPSNKDVESFKRKIGISANDRVILFAGRLSTAKGLNQVQQLIKKLIKKDSNIKLLVAGKEVNVDVEIVNNTINTGWLSKKEMDLAYSISDITLIPSIYLDPFPTVALESMRLGVPLIVSVYTGAKEAVNDGITGFYVNPFDIDDFAEKTLNILHNLDLSNSMSNRSKQEFRKRFTSEICVNKYLDLFQINN